MNSNVTRATFLSAYDQFLRSKIELDRANAEHKNLLKKFKADGLDIDELKSVVKLMRLDTETRDAKFVVLSRYMAWLNKPIGFQASLLDDGEQPSADDLEAAEKHALTEAYEAGYVSGKTGAGMAFCSYEPGSEAHQQYALGVEVGARLYKPKAEKAKRLDKATAGVKRGRGRPRKDQSGLKQTHVGDSSTQSIDWGTPAGSA